MKRPLYSRLPGFAEAKIFMFGYEMLAESMLDLILEQSAKRLRDQAVFNYSQAS
jgi:galactose-1-phosphate uridylyltransferase